MTLLFPFRSNRKYAKTEISCCDIYWSDWRIVKLQTKVKHLCQDNVAFQLSLHITSCQFNTKRILVRGLPIPMFGIFTTANKPLSARSVWLALHWGTGFLKWIIINSHENKKVLLRDCKRRTAHSVAYQTLGGGGGGDTRSRPVQGKQPLVWSWLG